MLVTINDCLGRTPNFTKRPSSAPTITQGQTINYSNNICIDEDTPIVATSKGEITYVGKYNSLDPTENEMMSIRWKTFKFYRQIAQSDQVDLTPCPKCFAKLIMEGTE